LSCRKKKRFVQYSWTRKRRKQICFASVWSEDTTPRCIHNVH
jgi:hypothetical protein